jgi:hypothetical protein
MSSIATAVSTINVPFRGASLYLVSKDSEPYVPMKPVVEGMGLTWQSQHEKLKQRFSKGITEIMIPSAGGKQAMTCLAFRKFAAWLASIQPNKVKPEIRETVIQYQEECDDVLYEYWTKGQATNPRKTTTDDRTPLRDAINMLVGKKGIMYPEAYSFIHQRFNVAHIDELEADQLPVAIEYIHRLAIEGEYLGKQEALPAPVSKQFTDEELCKLCWMWNHTTIMIGNIADVYPILRVAEHRLAGAYWSMSHEYPHNTNEVRKILERETSHIACNNWTSDNWRVLNRMRVSHPSLM